MNLLNSIVQVLILMLFTAPLISWVGRRAKSEPTASSLERFRVQVPLAYRRVFIAGAVFFAAFFAVLASLRGEEGDALSFLCVGTTFALVSLGTWLVYTLQLVEIDGEAITCRGKVGRTRRLKVADISRATRSNSGAIRLYAQDRCIARLSGDCVNVEALAERLEAEGIEVKAHEQAPLTALSLYREAISLLVGISAALTLLLLLVFDALAVAGGFPWWWTSVFALAGGALISVFLVGLGSLIPARGLVQLKAQERELGFSFADEMARRGAAGVRLCDDEWFVRIGACAIVAFRRGYVKSVSVARQGSSGWECLLTDYGENRHVVRADQATLAALRAWARSSQPAEGMRPAEGA